MIAPQYAIVNKVDTLETLGVAGYRLKYNR
jgi:hypothetical protein